MVAGTAPGVAVMEMETGMRKRQRMSRKMSKWGNCSRHETEYDTGYARCGCDDGMREDDSGGYPEMVICWRCKGEGEVEVPVCEQCDDEYYDEEE